MCFTFNSLQILDMQKEICTSVISKVVLMLNFRNFSFICVITGFAVSPLYAQQEETSVRPAKVWVAHRFDRKSMRQYPAIVQPSQETILSFRVSGQVIELPVRASTRVEQGDVIARLDPRDFEKNIAQLQSQRDQAVAQLQAMRAGARAGEVAALEAGIAAVQANVDQAAEQVVRTRELAERGVVSAAKLTQDEAALKIAEAELRAKNEELTLAKSGARQEEIDVAEAVIRGIETQVQTARDNLADATLRAPFDGIIARRDIDNFSNIKAGQEVVLLQKISTVALVFDIPGPDVISFSEAEDITTLVTLSALPDQEFPAELVEFSTQADAATQTYRARVAATMPEGSSVLPGMIGKVIVSYQNGGSTEIIVPITAVGASADGSAFVWLVDPAANTVTKQSVTLGEAKGDKVVVIDGVADGDTVVSAGVSRLLDGMAIRPITKVGG